MKGILIQYRNLMGACVVFSSQHWHYIISIEFLYFLSQDEFLDVIYWLRQIIAIILGVIWGVAPLKGFLGIAM